MPSGRIISYLFAVLAITGRVGYFISTPLWLDHFKGNNSAWNSSDSSTLGNHHGVSVFFLLLTQWTIATVIFGSAFVIKSAYISGYLHKCLNSISWKNFLIVGISQGISSVLFNFALSGTRTPPYLQAILANFSIPIQFIVR